MSYIYDLTDTWDDAGTTFSAIKMNVTNTASAAASKLVQCQIGGTDKFTVDKDGDGYFAGSVGIGTTSPSDKLTVESSTTTGISVVRAGIDRIRAFGDGTLTWGATANQGTLTWDTNLAIVQASAGNSLAFNTNGGSERMRIDSSGNVGIGETSPGSWKLNVRSSSTSKLRLYNDTGNGNVIDFLDQGWQSQINASGGSIAFNTGGTTEAMRITSAGNVGIGTTSPSAKLHVSDAANGKILISGTSTSAELELSAPIPKITFTDTSSSAADGEIKVDGNAMQIAMGGSERCRIDSSGNLLVGTTSVEGDGLSIKPRASGLATTTQLYFDRADTATQGNVLSFNNNGTNVGIISHTNTATTYSTSSDARLKENIADADDAATLIDALQVRKFDWRVDGSHQRYGMIAQELQEVAPEAVTGEPDSDEMMGVDYSKLVPMLVKEIQSLRARVAQLEGE